MKMNKIGVIKMRRLFYFISAAIFTISSAQAGVRSIVDWDGGMADLEKSVQDSYCAKECEGYDIMTVQCEPGEVLVDCPVKTCEYFHRCDTGEGLAPSLIDTYVPAVSK